MKQVDELLSESARRLFAAHCQPERLEAAEELGWDPSLWQELERAEMTRLGQPEELGGSGGGLAEAAQVVRLSAGHAAPVPLAETCLVAGSLLVDAGQPLPPGPLTAARLENGSASAVPYARFAAGIVLVSDRGLRLAEPAEATISPGVNLAGEPRDDIRFSSDGGWQSGPDPARLWHLGALARSIQSLGALERILEMTSAYVREREQFGQPLSRFQAVQQQLALLAGEAAAARAAVEAAVQAPDPFRVAAAKQRSGQAAGEAAAIAHQLHGAIGFTREHGLQRLTRRLWSWRDEYGTEAEWAARLGGEAAAQGAERLWPLLTG